MCHGAIRRLFHTRERQPFLVRDASDPDLEKMVALQRRAMTADTEYFVRTLAEFDRDHAQVESQLLALLTEPRSLWILALEGEQGEGALIGALTLHGGEFERIRHVGHFGMIVGEEFRSQGVGSALVESMLTWAQWQGEIEKITTRLFTNNQRAIGMLARYGFVPEGRRHREYLVSPGRYLDAVMLAKWLK